eukprot:TRINITY_DN1830_c0_g1_i3.p1 TRINITY_DN1830_c0_g1~~TRINITY_DN1830_c0_g1_i3.p1  ORF type:complete len:2089 (+),score=368.20 TRINITY_DN1830_c0_g1_i3:493-6267(+)
MVQTGMTFNVELYGVMLERHCHVADPEACWKKRKRREILAGVRGPFDSMDAPSEQALAEPCAFEAVLALCDLTMMALGVALGHCGKCTYFREAFSPKAVVGRTKVPLPESFRSTEQLVVGCTDTSRGIRTSSGRLHSQIVLTCVDGTWFDAVGKEGLTNFVCHDCVQVGKPELASLAQRGAPEIYFVHKRDFKFHYGWGRYGCMITSKMAPGPLRVMLGRTSYCPSTTGDVSTECSAQYYYEDGKLVLSVAASYTCLVPGAGDTVTLKSCNGDDANAWVREGYHFKTRDGTKCLRASGPGGKLITDACSTHASQQWDFKWGECSLQLELATLGNPVKWRFKMGGVGYVGHDVSKLELTALPDVQRELNLTNVLGCRLNQVIAPQYVWNYQPFPRDLNLTTAEPMPFNDAFVLKTKKIFNPKCMWRGFSGSGQNIKRDEKKDVNCSAKPSTSIGFCDCNGNGGADPSEFQYARAEIKKPATCNDVCGQSSAYAACLPGQVKGGKVLAQLNADLEDLYDLITEFEEKKSETATNETLPSSGADNVKDACAHADYPRENNWSPEQSHLKHGDDIIFSSWSKGGECSELYFLSNLQVQGDAMTVRYQCVREPLFIRDQSTCEWVSSKVPNYEVRTKDILDKGYNFKDISDGKHNGEMEKSADLRHGSKIAFGVKLSEGSKTLSVMFCAVKHAYLIRRDGYSTWDSDDGDHAKLDAQPITGMSWEYVVPEDGWTTYEQEDPDRRRRSPPGRGPSTTPEERAKIAEDQRNNRRRSRRRILTKIEEVRFKDVVQFERVDVCVDRERYQAYRKEQFQDLIAQRNRYMGRESACVVEAPFFPDAVKDLQVDYTLPFGITDIGAEASVQCAKLHDGGPTDFGADDSTKDAQGGDVGPDLAVRSQALLDILRDRQYYVVPGVTPDVAPIYSRDHDAARAADVGYYALIDEGSFMWSIMCPPGAVVAHTPMAMSPHCINVGATEEENEFTMLPASAVCPEGFAVAGWYNAWNQKAYGSYSGGPELGAFEKFKLKCRRIVGLARTCEKRDAKCANGAVVGGFSYEVAGGISYFCCQVPRSIGVHPLSASLRDTQAWEGYYCPVEQDETGRLVYQQETTLDYRSQTSGQLVWDRTTGAWRLAWKKVNVATIPGNELYPDQVDQKAAKANVGVVKILDFAADYVQGSLAKKGKEKASEEFPKLETFEPRLPKYDQYCGDDIRHVAPGALGGASLLHPCHQVKKNRITEQAIWQCFNNQELRDKVRGRDEAFAFDMEKRFEMADYAADMTVQVAQLVGQAAASWIPGSYSDPVGTGMEIVGEISKVIVRESHSREIQDKFDDINENAKAEVNADSGGFGPFMEARQKALDELGKAMTSPHESHPSKIFSADTGDFASAEMDAVPKLVDPGVWFTNDADNMESLNAADYQDCDGLQFGMSKILCDVFCIGDSVKQGDEAIKSNLQKQDEMLYRNLRKMFAFHTGLVTNKLMDVESALLPQADETRRLAASRQFPAVTEEIPAAVIELPSLLQNLTSQVTESTGLRRDLPAWHRAAGASLLRQVSSALSGGSLNVSRGQATTEMISKAQAAIRSYGAALRLRPKTHRSPADAAASHLHTAAQSLGDRISDGRARLRDTASMLRRLRLGSAPRFASDEVHYTLNQLLAVMYRVHEKHVYFIDLKHRAMDLHDALLADTKVYTSCGTDLATLKAQWQRANAAEDAATDALLQAWAASLAAEEHLGALLQQGLVDHLLETALEEALNTNTPCGSTAEVAQELHSRAAAATDLVLLPVVRHLAAFAAVARQQQAHLRAEKVPAPKRHGLAAIFAALKSLAADGARPTGRVAEKQVAQAMELGVRACDAVPPPMSLLETRSTEGGFVEAAMRWLARPLQALFGKAAKATESVSCGRVCYEKVAPFVKGQQVFVTSVLDVLRTGESVH